MAYEQDIIQLPVRFFDYTDLEGMAVAINRNFNEVERYLSILQGYVKQASGGAVSNLPSVLSGLAPNGIFDVSKLSDKMVGLEHELQIAAEAVTEAKIAVEAITSNKIATDAVTEQKIAASAVTALKIANGSLELAKFATGLRPVQVVNSLPTLPDADYPQGATVFLTTDNKLYRSTGAEWTSTIATGDLTDTLVGLDHELQIANEAITEAKIAVEAVTNTKIATNAVSEAKIADASVTATKLAQNAVTTDKIVDAAITDMKLAAGAVTEAKTNWNQHLIY